MSMQISLTHIHKSECANSFAANVFNLSEIIKGERGKLDPATWLHCFLMCVCVKGEKNVCPSCDWNLDPHLLKWNIDCFRLTGHLLICIVGQGPFFYL